MAELDSLQAYLSRFVTNGAIPLTVAVGLVGTFIVVRRFTARYRCTTRLAMLAVWSVAAIVGFCFRVDSLGTADRPWVFDGTLWASAFHPGTNWVLNAMLFVPAGAFLTVMVRAPFRVATTLVAVSALAESLQQLTRWGIGDPSDFVANTIGAIAGVGAALAWIYATNAKLT
jgi:hypothetical protein